MFYEEVVERRWFVEVIVARDQADVHEDENAEFGGSWLRLVCPGVVFILACVVFVVARPWSNSSSTSSSKAGGQVPTILPEKHNGSPRGRFSNTLMCCGRGSGGRRGMCLLRDARGVCCGAELALQCAHGSLCYMNGHGHPFCCVAGTAGCHNVCLDLFTRDMVLRRGGFCNSVSPQGFDADGVILYVDALWDGTARSYRLDGTQNIRLVDPPIRLGAGDITMAATITPRVDGRVSRLDEHGNSLSGVLFARIDLTKGTGFVVTFKADTAAAIFSRGGAAQNTREQMQSVMVDIAGVWRAKVPVSIRIIRQGLDVLFFVDNMPATVIQQHRARHPIDVDSDLNEPLLISPQFVPPRQSRHDLDANIADMSISSTAEFP